MHAVLGPIFGLYHLLRDEFSLQLILKPPPSGLRVYKAPKEYSNVNIHMWVTVPRFYKRDCQESKHSLVFKSPSNFSFQAT